MLFNSHNFLGCIRGLGLWSCIWISVDATNMVKRMGTDGHNGKRVAPIVLSCVIWGPLLLGSKVEFHCDNSIVVNSISKGSSKEIMVMHLLCCLWFFSAHFNTKISTCHIRGTSTLLQTSCLGTDYQNSWSWTLTFPVPWHQSQRCSWSSYHLRDRIGPPPLFYTTSSVPSIHSKGLYLQNKIANWWAHILDISTSLLKKSCCSL